MSTIGPFQQKEQVLRLTATIVFFLATTAWTAQGLAQYVTLENKEISDVTARDPGGYWTPDQLRNAQSLPVPLPSISLGAMGSEVSGTEAVSSGPEVSFDGQNVPEGEDVEPDLNDRLFTGPAPQQMSTQSGSSLQDVRPEDVGSVNAYFSSSRLVPDTARLYYPYRAVGKLFFKKGNQNFICSAAVLRPRLILTAGHCVHQGSGGAGGFFGNFLFVPAYHNGSAPYQAWNWRWVTTTSEWSNGGGAVPNKADFAIIELEDRRFGSQTKKIGQVTGWLGYRTNALNPNHTKKLGYPGNHDNAQIMHQVDSQHFRNGGQSTVLYGSDMRGGSSGGPWVENFGVKAAGQTGGLAPWPNRIVGVTSYGYVAVGPKVQGSSILNQSFLTILNAACAHRAGNC